MNIERRYYATKVEFRAASKGQPALVRGYAAVYGSPSKTLRSSRGEFVEIIERGFFDNVLNDDVPALFNHDANLILARSNAGKGTLSIFSDGTGLGYAFSPDLRQNYATNLVVALERGDVKASSFGFSVREGGDKWERRSDGMLVRTLCKGGCKQLYDVSPVTYAAYDETEVSLRSLDAFLTSAKVQEESPVQRHEAYLRAIHKITHSSGKSDAQGSSSSGVNIWEHRLRLLERTSHRS
jgi:HK97 family phage prohead protease